METKDGADAVKTFREDYHGRLIVASRRKVLPANQGHVYIPNFAEEAQGN